MIINLLYFFLIILFSLFSNTLLDLNLLLILIISYTINSTDDDYFFLAFSSGLIFDLVKGGRLGQTSLIFLIISFLVSLYRAKFSKRNFLYSYIFCFLFFLIVNFLSFHNLYFLKSVIYSLLIIPVNILVVLINQRREKDSFKF